MPAPSHKNKGVGEHIFLIWSVPTRRETKCSIQQNKQCSATSSRHKWQTQVLQLALNTEKIIERLLFIFSILLYHNFYPKILWLPVSCTNHFVIDSQWHKPLESLNQFFQLVAQVAKPALNIKYYYICSASCTTCSTYW